MSALLEIVDEVAQVAGEVVRPAAAEVDREAAFPAASIAALRNLELLGMAVPAAYGGAERPLRAAVEIAVELGRHCTSTALIWATHQTQIARLAEYPDACEIEETLRCAAEHQLLLAPVVPDGAVAIDRAGDRCRLALRAQEVPYALNADGYLIETGGRLVLVYRDQVELTECLVWDTPGLRGVGTAALELRAAFPAGQIVPAGASTWAQLLRAAVFTGLATDAVERAGAPDESLQLMRDGLWRGVEHYERSPRTLQLHSPALEVVASALRAAGISGAAGLSRHLRDAAMA